MQLTFIDWLVVAAYFLLSLGIGFYYRRMAGKSIDEFFASGHSAPWWLAGTSMVATTVAVDTPLAVSVGITPEFPIGDLNITED